MKEFFGFGGYQRAASGAYSWQHLSFVTSLVALMALLAVLLGRKNRLQPDNIKNRVLVWSAIIIDGLELLKIIVLCLRGKDPWAWLYTLPLFLCSIQLIAIPLAAFSHGRIRQAALDFVCIFGLLGALTGTYGAAQNYNAYPVLSMDNVISGLTHTISGFASLYIMISGMASLKTRNISITFAILFGFCIAAHVANILVDYNYMFLVSGDGTPYDILYNLVGGSPVLYPLGVVGLFVLYIGIFYLCHHLFAKKKTPVS